MSILNTIIFSSLLLLLLLTPLPYATVETWSVTVWEIWIFATVLLWGILTAIEGRLMLSRNVLALPLLALLLTALLQLLPLAGGGERPSLSYDRTTTLQAAVRLLALIFFFVLFATFVRTDKRRMLVVTAIISLAFMIALIGIGQSYITRLFWQRGAYGPFVNRNHFAGFLEMSIGLTAGLLAGRGIRREQIAIYLSMLIVQIVGLVVSASRGGIISFVAQAVFLALIIRPEREGEAQPRSSGLARGAAITTLLALTLAGIMLLAGPEELLQNFSRLSLKTGTEVGVVESVPLSDQFRRRDIWQATVQMIKDHPVLGVGLGAYPLSYTRYDPSSGLMRVEQAHNDYLQIVADTGLIGGLMTLVFVVLLFRRGLSATHTRDRRHRAIVAGALTGCFAIVVHSFVDFNLQITANAQLFLALTVLATTPRSAEKEA